MLLLSPLDCVQPGCGAVHVQRVQLLVAADAEAGHLVLAVRQDVPALRYGGAVRRYGGTAGCVEIAESAEAAQGGRRGAQALAPCAAARRRLSPSATGCRQNRRAHAGHASRGRGAAGRGWERRERRGQQGAAALLTIARCCTTACGTPRGASPWCAQSAGCHPASASRAARAQRRRGWCMLPAVDLPTSWSPRPRTGTPRPTSRLW